MNHSLGSASRTLRILLIENALILSSLRWSAGRKALNMNNNFCKQVKKLTVELLDETSWVALNSLC